MAADSLEALADAFGRQSSSLREQACLLGGMATMFVDLFTTRVPITFEAPQTIACLIGDKATKGL